ncbi:MAG: glycosyltransferase, partial [Planctomycetes bacterium]|nr:glycosyltransferase [Planctomycetota bacterium]
MQTRDLSVLRVAHVGRYRPDSLNGVDVAVASMIDHLSAIGIGVEVWQFTDRSDHVRSTDHAWGVVFEIPSFGGRLPALLSLPQCSYRFLRSRSTEIDLIHTHSVFIPENLQAARLGTPYVVSPHGGYRSRVISGRHRSLKALWLALFERSYLDRASALLVNSVKEADELSDLVDAGRTVVLPNGITDDTLDRVVRPPSSGDVWLYLGRLDVETKGLDLLLEGYSRLVRSMGDSVPDLVVAGPDHRGGRDALIHLSQRLGIERRVSFPGPVTGDAKIELIESCRLFILLSRNEGLPLALLEAMALERPVVVSPGTNLDHLVERHTAG